MEQILVVIYSLATIGPLLLVAFALQSCSPTLRRSFLRPWGCTKCCDRIPRVRVTDTFPEGSEEDCSICLEALAVSDQKLLQLECGHLFHTACVESWIRDTFTCPMCRAYINYFGRCTHFKVRSPRRSGTERPKMHQQVSGTSLTQESTNDVLEFGRDGLQELELEESFEDDEPRIGRFPQQLPCQEFQRDQLCKDDQPPSDRWAIQLRCQDNNNVKPPAQCQEPAVLEEGEVLADESGHCVAAYTVTASQFECSAI